jgi:hypothetical protein
MRLSCPHYLDARVASGQSHVDVSENYDAVGLARLLPGAKFEGLWPRVESARRRKTARSNGATLDLRGCN